MTAVLHTSELLAAIFAYQHGFAFPHLRLVKALRVCRRHQVALGYVSHDTWIATTPAYLREWLGQTSLTAFERLHGCDPDLFMIDDAARAGRLELVQFLHNHGAPCTVASMDCAAAQGYVEIVEFLTIHRPEGCTTEALDGAACRGHVDVVRYLHVHRNEGCTTRALDRAARNGHFQVVQYLSDHLAPSCCFSTALDIAAACGHFDIVQWLHPRTPRCSKAAVDGALHGHVDIAKFLLMHRREGGSEDALVAAATANRCDILELLVHTAALDTTTALAAAAGRGHLEAVKLLISKAAFKSTAIRAAVQSGHVDVVKHLVQNDPMLGVDALVAAASTNKKDLLHVLVGLGGDDWLEPAWRLAKRHQVHTAIARLAPLRRETACRMQ
ncbi:hypothetical protein LEN26_011917 [Aphanomyces euteiches]|nr:hypothetical protein LEN26_011917 [Aphanomyces euteiches]